MAQPNLQFVAVEQRSRQSCLDVLHSLCLELILGLELFRRLTAQNTISTLALDHRCDNHPLANHLRISSTCDPTNVSNTVTTTRSPTLRNSRSSLALRHTRLDSLNLSRPETSRSPLVLRPSNARRAHGGLEVIDGRGDARSALPRCWSCAGWFRHVCLARRKKCR
jgi:hypothetical protein